MRRLALAIFALLVIIGFGIFEQIYITRLYKDMKSVAVSVSDAIEEDVSTAMPAAEDLRETWLEKRSFLEAFTPHNETKEMVLRIAELIGYIKTEDDKSAQATIDIIIEMCENTPHILAFHWEHIF